MAIVRDVTREEYCRHNAYPSYDKTSGIIWHIPGERKDKHGLFN